MIVWTGVEFVNSFEESVIAYKAQFDSSVVEKPFDAMRYCVDWVQGTVFCDHLFDLLDQFKSCWTDKNTSFEWVPSSHGLLNYSNMIQLNGQPLFNICWIPSIEDQYVPTDTGYNLGFFIQITGSGIRYLLEHNFALVDFFRSLTYKPFCFKCSRLDLACDFFEDHPIIHLVTETFSSIFNDSGEDMITHLCTKLNFNTLKRYDHFTGNNLSSYGRRCVTNWSIGSSSSSKGMFRCYDKLFEYSSLKSGKGLEETSPDSAVPDFWYRFECEMRKKYAQCIFDALYNQSLEYDTCLESAFRYSLSQLFKIYDGVPYVDQNVSYCYYWHNRQLNEVFSDFIEQSVFDKHIFIQEILDIEATDRLGRLKDWALTMSPLIMACYKIMQLQPDFCDRLMDRGLTKLDTVKYKLLNDEIQEIFNSSSFI